MEELHWYENVQEDKNKKKAKEQPVPSRKNTEDTGREAELSGKRKYFNKYLEDVNSWIDEIALELEVEHRKDWAFNALRGVLYALRDRLTYQELFQFSAQLPTLIRGIFFEGYRYADKPEKYHADEFLTRIEKAMGPAAGIPPEQAFGAVLNVLYNRMNEGELNDIYIILPRDIKKLWDEN